MQPLTIAQITDLHLRHHLPGLPYSFRRRGRLMPELLRRALDIVRRRGADLIALTGDLVDVPDAIVRNDEYYELPRARRLAEAEADYRLLKELLDDSGVPYTVLPGNHDHAPTLWRVFSKDPESWDVAQGYRIVRFADIEGDQHVPRRLDRERHLLDAMLADASSPPQIHLQHYVITPQISEGWPFNYLECEHLRATLIQSRQVVLCLSGHYHPGVLPVTEEGCTFATGQAFGVFPHPVSFYTIADRRVTHDCVSMLEKTTESGHPVVFLDRDGVITAPESYRTGPAPLTLIDGSAEAMASLRRAGYALVVVSNQSAIGLGYVTRQTVELVNDRMCELLAAAAGEDALPDAIAFSASAGADAVHPRWADASDAKPRPKLLEETTKLLDLRRNGAWFVGDRLGDMVAARAYGARPVLVATGGGRATAATLDAPDWPDLVRAANLADAARHILQSS